MGKNGLLFRLQRRLLLAGQSSQFHGHDSLPRSWHAPSKPARKAKIRPLATIRLSGFSSIKSLKNTKKEKTAQTDAKHHKGGWLYSAFIRWMIASSCVSW